MTNILSRGVILDEDRGSSMMTKRSSTMTGGASYEEVAIDVRGRENVERIRVFPSMTKGKIVGQSCH